MKYKHASVDEWIGRLVAAVNGSPREPKRARDIPTGLRLPLPDPDPWAVEEYFDWQIVPVADTPWIDTLEARLPHAFPPSFRSLVRRFAYPDFEVGPLWLLANTGEPLNNELGEFHLRDAHLSSVLFKHGYLPFARPATGDYDPICFDTKRKLHGNEYPIVRVDHEEILCHSRIRLVTEIAPSFLAYAKGVADRYAGEQWQLLHGNRQ